MDYAPALPEWQRNKRKQISAHVNFLLLGLDVYYDYTQRQYKSDTLKLTYTIFDYRLLIEGIFIA